MIYVLTALLAPILSLLTIWKSDRVFVWSTSFIVFCYLILSIFVPTTDWNNGDRLGPIPVVYVPVMVTSLCLVLMVLWKREIFVRNVFDHHTWISLGFFVGWYVVSSFFRGGFIDGLPYLIGFGFIWTVFVVSQKHFPRPNERLVRSVYCSVIALILLSCSMAMVKGEEPYYIPLRYLNRNCGVMILLGLLPFCFGMLQRRPLRHFWSVLPLSGVLFLIYVSQSRSAILAAGFFVVGMLVYYRKHLALILRSLIAFGMVVLLAGGYTLIRPGEQEDLLRRFEQIREQTQSSITGSSKIIEGSTHERVTHLLDAWEVIKKNWFWGTGLGYKNYLKADHQFKIPRTPHNIIVNYFAQMGVLGFAIFAWINFRLFFSRQLSLAWPCRLFALSVLVHLLFNDYYINPFIWSYLGLTSLIDWEVNPVTARPPSSQS